MTRVVSNLRDGMLRRSAALLIGVGLGVAVVVGVAAVPSLRVRDARAAQAREAREAIQRRRESNELNRLIDEHRPERLERARELLLTALPPEPNTLELHATLRLLAGETGIELQNIQFGRIAELEAPFFDGRAARLEVRIGGRATPAELVSLMAGLDELDRPIRAFELGLSRADSKDSDYALRLGIGAYCALAGRSVVSNEPLAAPEGETQ